MICEKAYAKVNLGLKVVGKRSDGYHELEMVMASIDLYDELSFQESDKTDIIINKDICKLEDNLVYKTIMLMKQKFSIKKDVLVTINKNIPIGGGLAGGSSDAAATIRGINKLWNLRLKYQEMYDVAVQLGSDVPFCLTGDLAYVKGRGEIITALNTNLNAKLFLVIPDYSCYTKDIFNEFSTQANSYNIEKLIDAIYQRDIKSIGNALYNDLEEVVNKKALKMKKTPVSHIKTSLVDAGCLGSVMSGSGSTVIGLVGNDENFLDIHKKISQIYPNFIIKYVEIV